MDFEALDAVGYRALDTEAYQARRALILSYVDDTPEDATVEQIRSITDEVALIKAEDALRDSAIELRNHKAAAVIAGAGDTLGKQDDRQERKLDASLGQRVWDQMQERGFNPGEKMTISNVAFRTGDTSTAHKQVNVNPALSSDYGAATLEDVDDTIREGYRRPLSIADLFSFETTEKDAVSFFVEGAVDGAPAMTAEGGDYSQLHFGQPTKKTNAIKKVTAFWKNSDELMSDSPRFVSHIDKRAPYLMDITIEDQLVSGDGTGNNITGLLNTNGVIAGEYADIDMAFVESILDYQDQIYRATANYSADALLVSYADYTKLLKLKDKNDQYVLGGPTSMIYGQNVAPIRTLWGNVRIVPSRAMTAGTMVLGAFKQGGTVIRHVTGRRFEMDYSGDDFTKGLVTFRTSERFTLAVEAPNAFVKLTKKVTTGGGGSQQGTG